MKQKFRALIACLLTVVIFASSFSAGAAFAPEQAINSEAAYLVNLDTGMVMYKKNENKKLYPASLTKIMTAILVLESGKDLDKTVVTAPSYIFDDLWKLDASTAGIMAGEQITLRDLLYALMLPSACEAGSILADYFGGGSIPKFVAQMNARAKELGCKNTHFVNAHGLHNPDQQTTAYDMYLITKHAMTLTPFMEIACTPKYTMQATNKHPKTRNIYHTNEILRTTSSYSKYYYPYMKGIKTGTTDESGKNLVSTASKNGYNYLLITMGAPLKYSNGKPVGDNGSYIDAINLYDWAFDNFKMKTVITKTDTVADVKVTQSWDRDHVLLVPEKDVTALLPSMVDPSSIQKDLSEVPKSIQAPVKKGQVICQIKLKLADEQFETVNLVASEDAGRSTILYVWDGVKGFFSSLWFKLIVGFLVVLLAAYFFFMVMYNKKRQKNKVVRRKRKF